MTVAQFTPPRRTPIADPAEIAAIETLLSTLGGVIAATGGFAALNGRDMHAMTMRQRAAALTPMYDDGEVVMGWRHGDGAVVNMVVERLESGAAVVWLARLHIEEDGGHALRGALAARDPVALGVAVLRAAAHGDPGALPSAGAALVAALRGD
jgi:hypothetical protein